MVTHLLSDGAWAECTADTCPRPFHLDLTAAAANQLPLELLLPILDVIDPPTIDAEDGVRMWVEADPSMRGAGNLHRGHGLPAVTYPDGGMEWWVHGRQHRARNLPAVIRGPVHREWHVDGKPHRMGGPAIIHEDGREEWYWHGEPTLAGGPRP